MQKTKKTQKKILTLHRETLRHLGLEELGRLRGGDDGQTTCPQSGCIGCATGCVSISYDGIC